MTEELLPGEVNDPAIGEAWADVVAAVEAYVKACAPYPISAKAVVSGFVQFAEGDIEEMFEVAREE